MTTKDIGAALELIHGKGLSYTEAVEGFNCTVRVLEAIDKEVMEFRNKYDNHNSRMLKLPSKNWNMVESDNITDYLQSRR